jgi:hypothetical protein
VATLAPGLHFSSKHRQRDIWSAWMTFWYPAGITFVLPAIFCVRWIRRPRTRPGCCRVCGYDLRATPRQCPECGATPGI